MGLATNWLLYSVVHELNFNLNPAPPKFVSDGWQFFEYTISAYILKLFPAILVHLKIARFKRKAI